MSIDLSFSTGVVCVTNFRDLNFILVAPNGSCFRVYNGEFATTSYTDNANLSIALRSAGCLNRPNFTSLWRNMNENFTGNYGFFASDTTIYQDYNGILADCPGGELRKSDSFIWCSVLRYDQW
jgi:hypothetical protein